jgi:hypothetical protein
MGIASSGLPSSHPQPEAPLSPDDWRSTVWLAQAHRMTGLLLGAIEAGDFPATSTQRGQLEGLHAEVLSVVLLIERSLLQAVTKLDACGIPYRVLKGSALSHLLYPDSSMRVYGDVDLLIPGDVFDRALKALSELGFKRTAPEIRPGFDRRFGKGATLERDDGLQLDIHRTLVMGPYGLMAAPSILFEGRSPFLVGGLEMSGLSNEGYTLHAAYSVALSDVRPRPVLMRDLVELVLHKSTDYKQLLRMAAAWRGLAVVARGVSLAWSALGITTSAPLADWASAYKPSGPELRLMRSYLSSERVYALSAWDAMRELPTIDERLAFAGALLLPSRAYREYRGTTPGAWVRRGCSRLLSKMVGARASSKE